MLAKNPHIPAAVADSNRILRLIGTNNCLIVYDNLRAPVWQETTMIQLHRNRAMCLNVYCKQRIGSNQIHCGVYAISFRKMSGLWGGAIAAEETRD